MFSRYVFFYVSVYHFICIIFKVHPHYLHRPKYKFIPLKEKRATKQETWMNGKTTMFRILGNVDITLLRKVNLLFYRVVIRKVFVNMLWGKWKSQNEQTYSLADTLFFQKKTFFDWHFCFYVFLSVRKSHLDLISVKNSIFWQMTSFGLRLANF